jgi:hypothetical protein
MGVMTLVMGGVFQAMSTAMTATHLVKQVTSMNATLATSMDAVVRDLLEVGQGLPIGRRIGIPNGVGAQRIVRPGPAAVGDCPGVTDFPDAPSLAAVTAGPGLGPAIAGVCTDVITVLMADATFESAGVAAIAEDGTEITIDDDWDISDEDTPSDNLRAGDLLMLTKGTLTTLLMVSEVEGQEVTFTAGDALNLNQFNPALNGTINKLRIAAPADPTAPQDDPNNEGRTIPGPTNATRIRMVTYFVDTTTSPEHPRLTRVINAGPANAIGFEVHGLTFSYDLFDGFTNPTAIRMTADDLVDDGPCGSMSAGQTTSNFESQCANKIRKVNVMLAMRSRGLNRHTNDFHRNTLFTQVSLRNLTFTDQY